MRAFLISVLTLFICFHEITAQVSPGFSRPERTYLHTDRDAYIAGEYLFYTLYLQDNYGAMSKYAYLVLRGRNNSLIAHERLEIIDRIAFGSVYLPDTLSSGVYQVVCYTNCMRNETEDVFFNKEIVIANRFDVQLNAFTESSDNNPADTSPDEVAVKASGIENLIIHLDKHVFNPREKISFSVESKSFQEKSVAHLSVSVSEIVPGIPVESSISEYFSNTVKKELTSGSKQNRCNFYSEISEPVIQGRVIPATQFSSSKDPGYKSNASGHYTILVSTPDTIVNMQYAKTDSMGSFRLLLNRYYNGKELFIRIKEDADANIVLNDKFDLTGPFKSSGLFNVHGIKSYLTRSQNIALVRLNYDEHTILDTVRKFLPANTIPRVYYKHYTSILPSDYVELTDFAEISKEILPSLRIRKSNGTFSSFYVNVPGQTQGTTEPEIFLDGVPIDDVNQIISLGSRQIRRIDMLPLTRYYGEMSIAGILSVFSSGLFINTIQFKTPTLKCLALSSKPYTKPLPYKPDGNEKRTPDLRQVLLWEPDIIMDKSIVPQIECYASDLQGQYRINIQGITSDGEPINGSAIIMIQSNVN
jgi:hypothetical protein